MFKQKTTEQIKAATRETSSGSYAFYNNPKYRGWIYQALLVLGLIYFFTSIISNTLTNMEASGIKTGFGFLDNTAGYDVWSLIPYALTDTYFKVFIIGFLNTILVSSIGIVFATILGFIFGIMYFSENLLLRKLSIIYVETFRNIPVLLQVVFWYSLFSLLPTARESLSYADSFFLNVKGFYIPGLIGGEGSNFVYVVTALAIVGVFVFKRWAKKVQENTGKQYPVFLISIGLLIGLPLLALIITNFPFNVDYPEFKRFGFKGGIAIPPELIGLATALSIYTGAFIAEAVRAGIQSVPKGQTEAARSIGMKESKIMSLIIVPQSMRVISPLLNSEYQSLVKNSTLATAIGYSDLFNVFVGTALNQVGQAIEIIFMTIIVYFILNMMISYVMNRFVSNSQLVGR